MRVPDNAEVYIRRSPVVVDGKTTVVEDVMVEIAPHSAVGLNWLETTAAERKRLTEKAMARKM